MKAVIKLKSNSYQISQENTNRIRILITNEEQDGLKKINIKRNDIKLRINKINNNTNNIKKISITNTEKLNKFRNDILNKMNSRIDFLINESDKIIKKKQEIFKKNIKILENNINLLNNTETKCNEYLDDICIDIDKRKIKITNLINNTLKNIDIKHIDITKC